jgi:aldose 1-epimerase
MSASPNGRQLLIAHGSQHAVIVEVGAGLRSYGVGDVDNVDGYRRDEVCDGGRGQLLLPWPNRIAGGRYFFGGADHQLSVNEPRTGCAIHGLTRALQWHVVDTTGNSVSLELDLQPSEGYPFRLHLGVVYLLDSSGLTARITATNKGAGPCPYGAGAHPYLRVADGAPIDGALLHIPADATLDTDERGIPTGAVRPVDGSGYDFRTPRTVGGVQLDTAFTRLRPDSDARTRISLTTQDGDGASIWMDDTHQYAMLYSGDTLGDESRRRRGLAIEPMTCAPDAFNSGAGLIILQPGEQHVSMWGITPH